MRKDFVPRYTSNRIPSKNAFQQNGFAYAMSPEALYPSVEFGIGFGYARLITKHMTLV